MQQPSEIVELAPDMRTVVQIWKTINAAARAKDVTKQAIHKAIQNESSCAGSYWMRKDRWETREEIRRENRKNLQSV